MKVPSADSQEGIALATKNELSRKAIYSLLLDQDQRTRKSDYVPLPLLISTTLLSQVGASLSTVGLAPVGARLQCATRQPVLICGRRNVTAGARSPPRALMTASQAQEAQDNKGPDSFGLTAQGIPPGPPWPTSRPITAPRWRR